MPVVDAPTLRFRGFSARTDLLGKGNSLHGCKDTPGIDCVPYVTRSTVPSLVVNARLPQHRVPLTEESTPHGQGDRETPRVAGLRYARAMAPPA